MSAVGFFSENAERNYPFLDGQSLSCQPLPTTAIVDCTVIMGIDALFDPAVNAVWLTQISNNGGVLTFQFATDAPGAGSIPLVFTRNTTDPEYSLEFAETAPASTAFASCASSPVWEGFLATGPLDDLLAAIPNGHTQVFTAYCWQLEPALIQTLSQSWLNGISLANYDRRHAVSNCAQSSEMLDRLFINASCLTGNIKIKGGTQISVLQPDAHTLQLNGVVGGGDAGVPCQEIPLYPGETPPGASPYLSGGPACADLIKSINGLSGPIIQMVGTHGITVFPHETLPHTLVIAADLAVFGKCAQTICTEIPLTDLFNTGLDASGHLQSDCGDDAHWFYYGSPALVTQNVPVGWLIDPASPKSKWISPACDPSYPAWPCGDYQFVTQFTLPPDVDPQYVQITGRAVVGGDVKAVYVNYQSTGISFTEADAWQQFVLAMNFQTGVNTITFSIRNPRPGPTGLRVEWLSACISAQQTDFANPQETSLALEC